jgi:mannosyltransferase OCH1-like enzyme
VIGRIILARLTKVLGNCTKPLSVACHAVCPRVRFRIPQSSGALLRLPSNHRIPKVIWQTNYTDRVTLAVYLNYLFNRLMAPTYAYRFMDTAERAAFVQRHCSAEISDCYNQLQFGAAQADMWRILVLREYGGVYLDIDAHLAWPLGQSIDVNCSELYLRHRGGQLSNYFIASEAQNPNLSLLLQQIVANIRARSSNNVFTLTGPGVFQTVLGEKDVPTVNYAQMCFQGSFTNEYFQYVDHPQGKWCHLQDSASVIKQS